MTESEIEKIADKVIEKLGDDFAESIYGAFEKRMSLSLGRGVWKMAINAFVSICVILAAYGAYHGGFPK